MKRILAFILAGLFVAAVIFAAVASARAVDLKDGDVLYECDFSNGMPEDFRIATSDKSRVYAEDGFLYLDARGVEFVRVLLPESLDGYGDYEITIHATISDYRDTARWGSITYRMQNEKYPYYQMCFRYGLSAANGVEFAVRTESDQWDVREKASYGEDMKSGEFYEMKVTVRDDHAVHSVNGKPVVDCYEANGYFTGAVGLQANFCILKIDDIKVTYLSSAYEGGIPDFVTVAQPDTGVIGGYAFSEYITSAEKLEKLKKAEIKPANAIFYVNEDLLATDADGKNGFALVDDIMTALDGRIMPTFYVKNEDSVYAVTNYLSQNAISDVFIMSDRDEMVLLARSAYQICRGVLDLTGEFKDKTVKESDLLSIRGRANAALASIVVIPDTAASQKNVKYLYDRLVAVWVGATSPVKTVTDAFGILSSGGHGAVTDNTELMYKVVNEYMSGNKLFRTPLNIGHRGIPTKAPENTVEGCKLAYELGADVVENDIYLTKDGYIVIMHDATAGRTFSGNLNIENSTLEELRELSVNTSLSEFRDCKIPTLEEYYEEFKGKDIQIFVEIKGTGEKLVQKFTEITMQYGMEGQVSVITFHENQIKNLHKHFWEMSAGFLCNPLVSGDTGEKQVQSVLKKVQKLSSTYNPSYSGHTAEYVYNANIRGLLTWPWTIDNKTDFIKNFMWGMNGITTNDCTLAAKYAKLLSSEESEYTVTEGEALKVSASVTNYEREKTDASADVRVIALDGDISVGDGNVLTFAGPGKYTYALEYEYKINNKNAYTIYTEPVAVTVEAKAPQTTVAAETEGADSTASRTDAPESTTGTGQDENKTPSTTIIILCASAAAVAVAAVIVIGLSKSKKKK